MRTIRYSKLHNAFTPKANTSR